MDNLKKEVLSIPLNIKNLINQRLKEFDSFKNKNEEDWFSELCFCLLTANSRAKTALSLQNDLGFKGFYELIQEDLVSEIKNHKHRFHNTKAQRIVEARNHFGIKSKIKQLVEKEGQRSARTWLVNKIKGLGLKEASHFLRNTGHTDVAIIDRHIIGILKQNNLLPQDFSVKNSSSYLKAEEICENLSSKLSMSLSKLDLCLWYLKTSEVLK
jgi:N-glycosylase/DNA lyase